MKSDQKFLIDYYQSLNVLNSEEIEEIIQHYELITIDKNYHLQENGQFSNYSYLVVAGMLIDYIYDHEGKKVVVNFIPEKYWAGGGRYYNLEGICIQSIEQTRLFRIKTSVLESFYQKNEKFAFLEVSLLRNALKSLKLRMLNSVSKPAIYNYEQLLLKFPDIEQRVSQKYLASFLGVTPQFFSKMKTEYLKGKFMK